jgi:hypothetical protein
MSARRLAPTVLVLAVLAAPATAGDFDAFWQSLSADEKALVDRVAADMFQENRMGAPTASFEESGERRKSRFRARAMKALGVDQAPKAPPKGRRDI